MLRVLAGKDEVFTDLDDLAAALGKKPAGGQCNSGMALLRNNGLIELDGAPVTGGRAASVSNETTQD